MDTLVKVSIVTICLNDLYGLKKTVDSVAIQTYDNIEHIIIDGGSKDGTVDYLNGIVKGKKYLLFYSEIDNGRSDAFNKGTSLATGELILYLNSGDVFLSSTVVEDAVNEWVKSPVDVLGYRVVCDTGEVMYADEEKWNTGRFPHQGLFIRKKAIETVGGYNEFLINRMDYDLFLKLVKKGCSHRFVDNIIARFDTGGISSTNQHNAELEGLGLELIYHKKISDDNIRTFNQLVFEENIDKSISNKESEKRTESSEQLDALKKRYVILRSLLNLISESRDLKIFFEKQNIKNVAIYGMGDVGVILYKLFKKEHVNVICGIDRDISKKVDGLEVIPLEKIHEDNEIDAVIVTNNIDRSIIVNRIKEYINCKIFTIDEVIQAV